MPIIPRFQLSQSDKNVEIEIETPHVRVSDMDFDVQGTEFSFWCKPYLLKLSFPHSLVDDDRAKAVYDPNKMNGVITVTIPKATPGQHFPDLDLITSLLQPRRAPKLNRNGPLVEVIGEDSIARSPDETGAEPEEERRGEMEDEENVDEDGVPLWCKEVHAAAALRDESAPGAISDPPFPSLLLGPSYGFNNSYRGVFKDLHEELYDVLELPDPESTPESARRSRREEKEKEDFDMERYASDSLYAADDDVFIESISFTPFWAEPLAQVKELYEKERRNKVDDGQPQTGMAVSKAASSSSQRNASLLVLETLGSSRPQLLVPMVLEKATEEAKTSSTSAVGRPLIQEVNPATSERTELEEGLSKQIASLTLGTDDRHARHPASPAQPSSSVSATEEKTESDGFSLDIGLWMTLLGQTFEAESALFTKEEKDLLLRIPNTTHVISPSGSRRLLLGLVDILLAFAYDYRTTQGEGNVESAWTISTLSPLLSWLDASHRDLKDTLVSSSRRIVCYPYLRSWAMVETVREDVASILLLGKRSVLKCLLYVYRAIELSDNRYLLNNIFLRDYIAWVQRQNNEILVELGQELLSVSPSCGRHCTGFPLRELELRQDEGEEESEDSSSEESDTSSEDHDSSTTDDDSSESSDNEAEE